MIPERSRWTIRELGHFSNRPQYYPWEVEDAIVSEVDRAYQPSIVQIVYSCIYIASVFVKVFVHNSILDSVSPHFVPL